MSMQDSPEHGTIHIFGVLLLRDELWNAHTIVVNDKHILLVIIMLIFMLEILYFSGKLLLSIYNLHDMLCISHCSFQCMNFYIYLLNVNCIKTLNRTERHVIYYLFIQVIQVIHWNHGC